MLRYLLVLLLILKLAKIWASSTYIKGGKIGVRHGDGALSKRTLEERGDDVSRDSCVISKRGKWCESSRSSECPSNASHVIYFKDKVISSNHLAIKISLSSVTSIAWAAGMSTAMGQAAASA